MTKTPLLDDLKRAAEPPAPKDFRPGVIYSGRMPSEITTDAIAPVETEEEWEAAVRAMGIHLPEGYGLALVEAVLAGSTNAAAWHRDVEDRGGRHTAYTAPNTTQRWRYRFKVVLKDPRADHDIAVLMKEARKAKRGKPIAAKGGSKVINLADYQAGKVDILGGTVELLERNEVALAAKVAEVRRQKPSQIVLVDPGDSTEGFNSAPNANRMNDLQETEQIRVWRRILWRWIETMSKLTEDLVVLGVPSNHCRVRQGKNALGPALDDWGIEVISQVADMASVNPEAFGHVSFHVPEQHKEYLLFTLADGKVLGVMHGHQVGKADALPDFIKKESRRGIGRADIVVVGHFHHLRVQSFGDGQFYFLCPTMDNGSSWMPGDSEKPMAAVLSFMVDAAGWRDIHVAWC